jgi:hypothetical protein
MTCHASKGLEFPAVAVVGQSLSEARSSKPYLPPALRRDPNDDLSQAESLLFVGISRAERAAVISFATSASGRPRSKPRKIPELLSKLHTFGAIALAEWSGQIGADEAINIQSIWGGELPPEVSMYSLGAETCRVRTYLEENLGARFRTRLKPLYPEFMRVVRQTLSQIVGLAIDSGEPLSDAEAVKIAEAHWPTERHRDHVHLSIYRPRALRWARKFARAFDPRTFMGAILREEPFEWTDKDVQVRTLRLQLIGHFQDSNGERFAIALQLSGDAASGQQVKWSDLKDYERLPFVLLHDRHGDLQPLVFFGEEGQLLPFRWHHSNAKGAIRTQAGNARSTFQSLNAGIFDGRLDNWICDRCPCRTICPGWIGAIPDKAGATG